MTSAFLRSILKSFPHSGFFSSVTEIAEFCICMQTFWFTYWIFLKFLIVIRCADFRDRAGNRIVQSWSTWDRCFFFLSALMGSWSSFINSRTSTLLDLILHDWTTAGIRNVSSIIFSHILDDTVFRSYRLSIDLTNITFLSFKSQWRVNHHERKCRRRVCYHVLRSWCTLFLCDEFFLIFRSFRLIWIVNSSQICLLVFFPSWVKEVSYHFKDI